MRQVDARAKLPRMDGKECGWDAATEDLPTDFLNSRQGLLRAQQLVTRKGDDACHDHASFRFVPIAMQTCGYMGKEAVEYSSRNSS